MQTNDMSKDRPRSKGPTKLWVCRKRDQVRAMEKALDLGWKVIVWGHTVYGERYERIVVDVPTLEMPMDEFSRFEDYLSYLWTRLAPNGVLIDQGDVL